jgi:putative tryptophan/tyrosine transport system substrate-binding protein
MKTARRSLLFGTATYSALAFMRASAQEPKRLPRVALVYEISPVADMAGAEPVHPYVREFIHALRDIGLVDGQNVIIDRRSAEGVPGRLLPLMQEVVASNVDVIVAVGPGVAAAMRATDRIPIVGLADDVLADGVVSSLAHPGSNFTGFGLNFSGFEGKMLQLLKEAAPRTSRIAVIAPAQQPGSRARWRVELDMAARSIQLDLLWQAVDRPEQYESAFSAIVREGANALFVPSTNLNFYHLRRMADFAAKQKLPSIYTQREFAEAGGLLSYGTSAADSYRHLAAYVKKILNGARPGDLPFEQPTKFELVLNLKTAKALGLAIPRTLLARADEVIQ